MDNNSSPKSNDDTVSELVLVRDNEIPLIPLHVDGQATTMDLFPCLSGTDDGSANVIKSDKLKGMGFGLYANRLNGEPSKEVANFCTLIASAGSGADVAISMLSFLKVNECFKNSVYGLWSPLANVSKEDFKSVPVWVKLHDVHITTFTEDG
ncbi:hypothetical protein Tco_1550192, partial [Tanacetum coccineum]